MDKRNSKTQMLKRITSLESTLHNVYVTGLAGIEYVGAANYASRESEAKEKLRKAMWDELDD